MDGKALTVEEAVQLVKLSRSVPMRPRAAEAVIALLRGQAAPAPDFTPEELAMLAHQYAQGLQEVA